MISLVPNEPESHAAGDGRTVRQHLIDPEECIRCNTCFDSCKLGAVKTNGQSYVVDAEICNGCLDCMPGCPTGAIDNWRTVSADSPYGVADQYSWEELPAQSILLQGGGSAEPPAEEPSSPSPTAAPAMPDIVNVGMARQIAPATAAVPRIDLYSLKAPALGTVIVNRRLTDPGSETDIRHIVLDFGDVPMPVLEGQTIGILPDGVTESGRPHRRRAYSVASARDGETPGRNQVALTVKRVVETVSGRLHHGVASNYLCDRGVGDTVRCVGPLGTSFLLPGGDSRLLMICTGTGIAPMRGFIERRRRQPATVGDGMTLFYGGRTPGEIAYHDEILALPQKIVTTHMAYSRVVGQPRRYVQDVIREQGEAVMSMLMDRDRFIYICGLKGMEGGVQDAFEAVCARAGVDWRIIREDLYSSGRLHIETY